jgi:hypothetical protein
LTAPPFTIAGFRETIRGLAARGYSVRSFHAAAPDQRHLILRHDIDQCITIARQLADAEAEEGWRSAWFVLVRTEMYNPFSRANAGNLRAMIAAGHEIGLHLDATHYASASELDAGARTECRMLEDITGAPVRVVSFHRPAQHLLGKADAVGGRIHTYMPRFMSEMGYSSDSRGEWRHGHPWDHAAVTQGRALQLLTHAIWWVGPDDRQGRGRLEDLVAAKTREYDAELAANSDVWGKAGERK